MAISRTMAITGANGNIGQKLARHLLAGTTTIRGEVNPALRPTGTPPLLSPP